MKKRGFKKKTAIFQSLLFSYISMLLVPILVLCTIFLVSVKTMEEQITTTNRASASQMGAILDAHIQNAYASTYSLLLNPSMSTISSKSSFGPEELQTLRQIQKALIQAVAQSYILSDAYVVFPNSGTVLSTHGIYNEERFSYYVPTTFHMTSEEFKEILSYQGITSCKIVNYEAENAGDPGQAAFVISKNTPRKEKRADIAVIALFDSGKLTDILNSMAAQDEFTTIIAGGGENGLFSNHPEELSSYEHAEKLETLGIFSMLFGRRPFYTELSSSVTDWEYYFVFPSDGYALLLRKLVLAVLSFFLFCIIGGTLFAYHVTKKQYSPLQILVDQTLKSVGVSTDSSLNEYKIIEKALNQLGDQKRRAETKLSEYYDELRKNTLCKILKGYYRHEDSLAALEGKYHFSFQSEHFLVIAYSIENINDKYLRESNSNIDSAVDFLYQCLVNASDEFPLPCCRKYTVILDEIAVCLVNLPDDETLREGIKREIQTMVENIASYIRRQFDSDILIAVSNNVLSSLSISLAYEEAIELIEYCHTIGVSNSILWYHELPSSVPLGNRYAFSEIMEMEQRFLNSMKAYDFQNARNQMNELISLYFRGTPLPMSQIKLHLYGLNNAMMEVLQEIRPSMEEIFFENVKPFERLYEADSVTALIRATNDIFQELTQYLDEKKRKSRSERDENILAFVNENYQDPNLNVAMIADYFQMSPSYLSRIFKQVNNVNLLDYIGHLRIEKAKELMADTDASLKDISEAVGFSNNLTMLRTFRKYEGITPSAYRDMLK